MNRRNSKTWTWWIWKRTRRDSRGGPRVTILESKLASSLLRITRHMSPLSPCRNWRRFLPFIPVRGGVDQFSMRDSLWLCAVVFQTLTAGKIVCRTNRTWSGYLGDTMRPLYQHLNEGNSRAKPGFYPKDVRKKDPLASSHNLELLDRWALQFHFSFFNKKKTFTKDRRISVSRTPSKSSVI